MRRTHVAVALIAAVLAVAACGQATAPAPSHGGPSGSPASSGPAPSDAALPAVSVECSGGFAGVQSRLDVRPDGTATGGGSGATGTPLTDAERAALAAALRRAATQSYAPAYETTDAADLFRYRISIGGRTVTADELALPPTLADVLAALRPVRTRLHLGC
jgi:hypothetical protein